MRDPVKKALGEELRRLQEEDKEKLAGMLKSLSNKEAKELYYDWEVWARDKQWVRDYDEGWPEPILLFVMGRSTGKTRLASEFIRRKCSEAPQSIALIGPTATETRNVMVLGPSGVMEVHPEDEKPEWNVSYAKLGWKNGSIAYAYSAENADRVRGGNNSLIWIDEVGSISDVDIFDQAMLTLRVGESRAILTTTPKKGNKILLNLWERAVFGVDAEPQEGKDVRIIQAASWENSHNQSETFKKQIRASYEGTRLALQELEGQMLFDSEEALWDSDMIAECKHKGDLPHIENFAIGVDPSVSTKKKSDMFGIVVAGIGEDGICYVLNDYSGKYAPGQWAPKIRDIYNELSQDASCVIVAERNQGGNMIETTLSEYGTFPIKTVFATQDKITRASPVAHIYDQGKVRHAKNLVDLENEMCMYDGTGKSPDRLDAMVYAVRHLMVDGKRKPTKRYELLI